MGMEQRLEQSQKLILSPQLRQYLKLLQLPILDLQQAIDQELIENPVLEEEAAASGIEVPLSEVSLEEPASIPEEPARELEFDNKIEALNRIESEFRESRIDNPEASDDDVREITQKKDYQDSLISTRTTLNDYLLFQAGLLNFGEKETEIAEELIGNIDEDGYCRIDLAEISKNLGISVPQAETILKALQNLDPPGVCARNLQECLLIQITRLGHGDSLPAKIIQNHFDLFERKQFREIAKALGVPPEEVSEAYHQIACLEPKPGRIFFPDNPQIVVPDATVSADENSPDGYKIEIHDESLPRLRISESYRKMLKDRNLDEKTRNFLREKIHSALWLIQGLSQRKSTLRLITEQLVGIQKDFFEKGFAHLKPLRMRDIAEKVKIHESTVSRAISGKYLATPQGTVPFRSFFSARMETEGGGEESQKSIRERIKNLVERENKEKPLSDSEIVKLLQTEGIKIARRTVAKYRELQKILPAHLRRER